MRVDQIGRERLSVFPHQKPSVGGRLTVDGQPPASAIPKVTSWVACASLSRRVVPTDLQYVRAGASPLRGSSPLGSNCPSARSTGTFKIFRFLAFR